MNPLLSVQDLTIEFLRDGAYQPVVRNVSFNVYRGRTLGIVGESGSGKSVSCMSIMGLLPIPPARIASGKALLYNNTKKTIASDDADVATGEENAIDLLSLSEDGLRRHRGNDISMIFQEPMTSLNPLKTVGKQIGEAVRLHQGLKGAALRQAVIKILGDVGIPEPEKRYAQYPHEFSGGMRQRVVIAIAIACRPKILICDEPTTALDVTIQAQILNLLKKLKKDYNLTVIFITHDLGVVANIADRVAVMYAGDIIEIGTSKEIFYESRHPYTWALLSSLPQLGVKGEELYSIKGTPPNLFKEVRGDAFAPRNPQALAIDFEKIPPYFDISPTHKAKTWLLDPRAPKIEPPAVIQQIRAAKKGGAEYGE